MLWLRCGHNINKSTQDDASFYRRVGIPHAVQVDSSLRFGGRCPSYEVFRFVNLSSSSLNLSLGDARLDQACGWVERIAIATQKSRVQELNLPEANYEFAA